MSKLGTVRQFCTRANAFLDDQEVAAAISFIAGNVSKHYLLTHIERDMAYPQLYSPQCMVYAKCASYIREQIRTATLGAEGAGRKSMAHLDLKAIERKNGYEFSASFHDAFKTLLYLEEIVNAQDAAYDEEMRLMQEQKDALLDGPPPWAGKGKR